MANPSGIDFSASVASNIDPITSIAYVWSDGDVYEIAQTDAAEGAASGASFNGLGVFNQAASKLLNKVNLIRAAQLGDEGNITTLFARNTWTNMQVFNAAGNYNFTAPVAVLRFILVGGGGGGAGASTSSVGPYVSGAGGGAGAYVEGIYSFGVGTVLAIGVGVSGTGGAPGASGASGGASFITIDSGSVGIANAGGGNPGTWGNAGNISAGGSGGVTPTVPTIGFGLAGGFGSDGQATQGGHVFTMAGNGAPGPRGGGGRAANATGSSVQNGAAPGAGGGGGYAGSISGGNGAPGIVVIFW